VAAPTLGCGRREREREGGSGRMGVREMGDKEGEREGWEREGARGKEARREGRREGERDDSCER